MRSRTVVDEGKSPFFAWPHPDPATPEEAVTDPRALLDAYAEQIVEVESEWGVFEPIKRADAAEAMVTALRAVLDLHPIGNPGVAAVAWCGGCGDADTAPDWPCPTVQAITAALEEKP